MPFQDIDEPADADVPAPPSMVERWLRKLFVEDLGLKLLALGITLFMWVAVSSENNPITIRAEVQLNFLHPPNLAIGNDPPKTVEVLLTGRKSKLDNLKFPDLVATVDLRDHRAGERVIRLSPEKVGIALPDGIKVESFQPGTVSVHLEPSVEIQLPVEVRIIGQAAQGYEVYSTQPTPAVVRVRGPASHVNVLQKVPTEAISVDGKKESFTVSQVSIDLSDQKVEALDSAVDVSVQIGERRSARSIDSFASHPQNSVPPRHLRVSSNSAAFH